MTQKHWRFATSSRNATEVPATTNEWLNIEFPITDLIEKSNQFVLTAELPGYEKDDIAVDVINGQILTLSGSFQEQPFSKVDEDIDSQTPNPNASAQKQQRGNDKDDAKSGQTGHNKIQDTYNGFNYLKKERRRISGTFKRSFELPCAIEADDAKASLNNGLLSITVPKIVKRDRKRIRID